MILKIIILVLLFIVLALVLFFLSCILVPAVKEQTKITDNVVFSKFEHNFKKLSEGEIVEKTTDKKAVVLCSCDKTFTEKRNIKALPSQTCAMIMECYGSLNYCSFSCIGQGDCKSICPQNAISIINGTAVIGELCCGCEKCVSICPKGIIKMVPRDEEKIIKCSNKSCEITTCSSFQKEEKIIRSGKKYFKIWQFCYKILKNKH